MQQRNYVRAASLLRSKANIPHSSFSRQKSAVGGLLPPSADPLILRQEEKGRAGAVSGKRISYYEVRFLQISERGVLSV